MLNTKVMRELDLLSIALQDGAVSWDYDNGKITAYYDAEDPNKPEGLVSTSFWIEDSEDDGLPWIFARDHWSPGYTVTDAEKVWQAVC